MSATPPSPKTILVVEDNAVEREGLATLLRRAGYPVVPAANGREALEQLAAGLRPGLILLDMLMPVLDGWQFLETLQQRGALPPVIVTTFGITTREWAEDHGCAGFLRKPIDIDELLAELRRCLPAESA